MKWLCLGAGAIGTYIGGSLALSGQEVVFVEQPGAAAELRQRGLRLDLRADRRRTHAGVFEVREGTFSCCDSVPEALEKGRYHAAIYALKSFDTASAAQAMRPYAQDMPPILCFSNGVENEATLAAVLGEERVIAATVTSAVGRLGVGDVVLERLRGVGVHAAGPLTNAAARCLRAAYLNPRLYVSATAMKWSKMFTNLIANPTSALLDMTAAEVLHDRRLYALEIGVLRECLAVMRAREIPVVDLPGTPVRALALAVWLPKWLSRAILPRAAGGGRGAKMPSFQIDLHSGRGQSEVEYLHGAVARAGQAEGVPTPISAFLTTLLMAATRGDIPREEFARQPEKLLLAFQEYARQNPTRPKPL